MIWFEETAVAVWPKVSAGKFSLLRGRHVHTASADLTFLRTVIQGGELLCESQPITTRGEAEGAFPVNPASRWTLSLSEISGVEVADYAAYSGTGGRWSVEDFAPGFLEAAGLPAAQKGVLWNYTSSDTWVCYIVLTDGSRRVIHNDLYGKERLATFAHRLRAAIEAARSAPASAAPVAADTPSPAAPEKGFSL